jgi:hypothetical protein
MLNLQDPVELDDLVVFRDDEDARKFYLLPDEPVIPFDDEGAPEFLFIRYIRDVGEVPEGGDVGGGYVQFRSVLTIAPERRQRVADALRTRLAQEQAAGKRPFGLEITSTEPLLAAPIWTSGTATLATFQASDAGLVRHATTSAPVDLAGDLGASFQLELDPDGAEIFWSAFENYRDTQIPILITYQLQYQARVSASMEIHASREVIHRRIWEQATPWRLLSAPFLRYVPIPSQGVLTADRLTQLRAQFAEPVQAMILRPLISQTVEQTIVNNEITVRIDTDEAGGGDQADAVQQMLFKVATDVLTDRVLPALFGDGTPRPGATSADAGSADVQVLEVSEGGGGGEASFDLTLSQRSAIERPVNPNGPVQLLVGSADALAKCFRELRLTDGFFALMHVTVSTAGVDFQRDGIDRIQVDLHYRQRDDVDPAHPVIEREPKDGIVLASAAEAAHWRFDLARAANGLHKQEYQYRTKVFYAQGAPPTTTDWAPSTDRMLLLTPRVMGALRVEATLTAPGADVDSARVSLQYRAPDGTSFETALELSHQEPTKSWFQHTGQLVAGSELDLPQYEYQVRYRVSGSEVVTPRAETTAQTLEIASPFAKTLTFVVRPQGSFEDVSNLSGDIVYEDSAHGYRVVQSFALESLTASFTFSVPIFEHGPETASWTARLNRTDGSSLPLEPGSGGPGTVWVGTQVDFLSVEIRPDLIDFVNDVELALVQLRYVDPANGLSESTPFTFSRTQNQAKTWKVARKDRALDRYDADIRYIAFDRTKSSEVHLRQIDDEVLLLDRAAAPGS